MTSIRVGVALTSLPRRPMTGVGLVELHPGHAPPRPATIAKWKDQRDPNHELALALPRTFHATRQGPFQFSPGAQAYVDAVVEHLAPKYVVVFTGAELTPGSAGRAALTRFATTMTDRGLQVVWQPRGLWEAEDALAAAAPLGIHVGLDLLATQEPSFAPRALAYGRLSALGTHARLGDGHIRRALDELLATGSSDARLVIESEDAPRRAERALRVLEGLAADSGGMASPSRTDESGDHEDFDDDDDDEDLDDDE